MSFAKRLSCGVVCAVLCSVMVLGVFGLSACGKGLSSKNNDSLNLAIDNVTVPSNGKLVYDITSLVDNVSYRSILLKRISRSDCRSYAQSLRSAGYTVEYEDTYSEGIYGFSATYPNGVTVSGYWEEDQLSLTVVDTADYEAYQQKQEEQSAQSADGNEDATGEDTAASDESAAS